MWLRTALVIGFCAAGPLDAWAADATTDSETSVPSTDVQGSGTLSDKLSTTNGVIHPAENPDPGISKPPPVTGTTTMPVIPPPGSPGGDPSVKPK